MTGLVATIDRAPDLGARRSMFREEIARAVRAHNVRLVRPATDRWNRQSRSSFSVGGGKGDAAHWINTIRVGAYIEPEWAYWITMHEIAHVTYRHPGRHKTDPKERIDREEVDAWLWAFDHTSHPPNGWVMGAIEACLGSYDISLREWMRFDDAKPSIEATARDGDYMRETRGVCF